MTKQASLKTNLTAKELLQLAGPVSDCVQIQQVLLVESVVKRHPDCTEPPADLAMDVRVATKPYEPKRLIQVQPRMTLIGRSSPGSTEELLRIEALFLVHYSVSSFDGLSERNFNAFGEMNGVFNVWPYWREFVQNMTVRTGLPALVVPVFRPLAHGTSASSSHKASHETKASTQS